MLLAGTGLTHLGSADTRDKMHQKVAGDIESLTDSMKMFRMGLEGGKPKAGKPVTTRHLAAALAEQHQLSKKQGLEMLEDLIGMITKHLKKGERVKIAGLGILLVRKRAARMGRNPMTGEAIKIKASRKVAFRAAKDLKMAI